MCVCEFFFIFFCLTEVGVALTVMVLKVDAARLVSAISLHRTPPTTILMGRLGLTARWTSAESKMRNQDGFFQNQIDFPR